MLSMTDVTVTYENEQIPAISNLTLSVKEGEFVCVLGKSGAGKSTFIRTINGIQPLSSGTINVLGENLNHLSDKKERNLRTQIGMIFQHFYLIPRMTVRQNVLTGRFGQKKAWQNIFGVFSLEELALADRYLEEVGLLTFANRRVEKLSGGQKQRVGIARAMMQEPLIFLGDEPVASLDPSTARSIFRLIKQIHEKNNLITIINVHDVELAKEFATRIIGLNEGKLIYDGKPESLDQDLYEKIYDETSLKKETFRIV